LWQARSWLQRKQTQKAAQKIAPKRICQPWLAYFDKLFKPLSEMMPKSKRCKKAAVGS